MKKPTKEQLIQQCEQLSLDNSVMMQALNALANGEFKTIGKSHHYTVKLARPCGAAGGLVLVTFAPPGQHPQTSAHYFEQWFHYWNTYDPGTNEEIQAVRELAFAAKRAVFAAQQEAA